MTVRNARLLRAYKQTAPISIGETREQAKTRAHDIEVAVISAVHDWIWANRPCCQLCQGRRAGECMGLPDQMHEDPPRSATRGLPSWERFNLLVCGRLCAACHADVTAHKIQIVFLDPVAGFMGPVRAK